MKPSQFSHLCVLLSLIIGSCVTERKRKSSGSTDTAALSDTATSTDSGGSDDAASPNDTETSDDAGATDTGTDVPVVVEDTAGPDAAVVDAGTDDAVTDDAGTDDAAVADAVVNDVAADTESDVGEVVEKDVVAPPDVIVAAGWYKLDTAGDLIMNDGWPPIVGTLVIPQDAAAIFPVDLTVPEKNILALTSDTMLLRDFPFACLGNDAILNLFNDVTQVGPSGTLKLLQGNPVADVLSADPQVKVLGSSVVDRIEIEMPYKVPQDDVERIPGSLCYGVRSQGDWYFSFEPVQAQLDDLNNKGTATLELGFPAKIDAIAVISGQNIGVDWIRFRTK